VNTSKSKPTKTLRKGNCHDAVFQEQGPPTITRASKPHQAPEEASTISHASSIHSSLTTTINSASLIQSAARSVLDSSIYARTSTSDVSDDEDDSSDIRQIRKQHKLSLPTLHSLQRKTLPTMPNEHDRKRFVGCLAAILASVYDFDVADDEDGEDARAESYAYLNRSEQGHESDDGGEYGDSTENYCHDFQNNDSNTNNKLDETFFLDTLDLYEDEGEEVEFNTYASLPQACNASFEYTDAHRPDIRISYSDSGLQEAHQRHYLDQYHHRVQSNRNQSTHARHRHQQQSLVKKSALAIHRHRKRRYDVLSKLLLSSAELLLLEESQARAFLPMLAQLLVPPTVAQKTNAQRIRRTKQQQPKRTPRSFANNANATRSATLASSAASASKSSPPRQAPSTTNSASSYSAASIATVTNNCDKNSSLPLSRENAKGINHYRFSNSYKMPISRSVPLANTNGFNINNNIFQHHCGPHPPDPVEDAKEEDGFWPRDLDDEDHLRPFLESLSPGAGFRCLSLFILQHLLHSDEGYDARIRHVIKKVGVLVLLHDMELQQDLELVNSEQNDTNISPQNDEPLSLHSAPSEKKRRRRRRHRFKYDELVGPATHKFEALEHSIAVHLIRISSKEQERLQQKQQQQSQCHNHRSKLQTPTIPTSVSQFDPAASALSRESIVRGLKIGSAGLVAGTLFAVTGGLAAPGISAGIAAIAGSTAATAAVAAIVTSTPAVTAIFGVGGGSLAAYKMNRRTLGLTEFEFRRQEKKLLLVSDYSCTSTDEQGEEQVELFSTVCISGWLRDEHDFQRPWGISPTNPRIRDRLELLERFYSVYRPDHVSKCKKILASWKGEEKQLWGLLKQKYGRDPDHLYPILSSHENGFHRGLTREQEEVLNDLFVEMGYIAGSARPHQNDNGTPSASSFHNVRERLRHPFAHHSNSKAPPSHSSKDQCFHEKKNQLIPERPTAAFRNLFAVLDESLHGPGVMDEVSITSSGFESLLLSQGSAGVSHNHGGDTTTKEHYFPPKHLATVWDYYARYGGEVYTVKWESEMLIELCDSVTDLAFDVINGATAQILRQTALSTLISAVALPYALINAANMIDGTWTLAVERADEAGNELARSLLFSRAGHRPVTLVGFSFGARAIYSCLKELAKYQEKWEASRENRTRSKRAAGHGSGDSGADQYPCTMREPASIVEDAILMGLPNHLSLSSWKACRRTVGGRLVNCYSRKDLILSLMFQFKRLAGVLRPVCGTCAVDVRGVENVDISDLVSTHQDYLLKVGDILMRVRHGQPFRTSLNEESNTNYY